MELHNVIIFVGHNNEKDKYVASLYPITKYEKNDYISISLGGSYSFYGKPATTINFMTETSFIEFVNSVKSVYEEYIKIKGYKK